MLRRRAFAFALGAFSAIVPALSLSAFADTFTPYLVATSSGSIDNYGLTSTGTLVVSRAGFNDYQTFTPPSTLVTTSMPPMLTFDNGVSCTPTDTGAYNFVYEARCNNGFEVFEARIDSNPIFGLYDGPDPVANLVFGPEMGGFSNTLLNSEGDIAAVAVNTIGGDENLLLVRNVTPEPSSVALLGTGLLGVVGVVRRRGRSVLTRMSA